MVGKFEEKLGLPPFKEALALLSNDNIKTINSLLTKLKTLTKDAESLKQAIEFLKIVQELDKQGTLVRLNELLTNLKPIATGSTGKALVAKLDKFEKILSTLMKE